MMKILPTLIIAGIASLSLAFAADPAKPSLRLTVKKHLLDVDHEKRVVGSSIQERIVTLRVEIVNVSSTAVDGAEIAGQALVMRAADIREQLVRERLETLKIPPLKPNEKTTLDLGKIQLHEKEWRNRKFEETLEEWQVTCTKGGAAIGNTVSSDRFESLEKDAVEPKADPAGPGKKKRRPKP
jgi:hypothetical protein